MFYDLDTTKASTAVRMKFHVHTLQIDTNL